MQFTMEAERIMEDLFRLAMERNHADLDLELERGATAAAVAASAAASDPHQDAAADHAPPSRPPPPRRPPPPSSAHSYQVKQV